MARKKLADGLPPNPKYIPTHKVLRDRVERLVRQFGITVVGEGVATGALAPGESFVSFRTYILKMPPCYDLPILLDAINDKVPAMNARLTWVYGRRNRFKQRLKLPLPKPATLFEVASQPDEATGLTKVLEQEQAALAHSLIAPTTSKLHSRFEEVRPQRTAPTRSRYFWLQQAEDSLWGTMHLLYKLRPGQWPGEVYKCKLIDKAFHPDEVLLDTHA